MSESLDIFTAITPVMRPMRGLPDIIYTLSANYRVSMVGHPGKAQRPRSMTGVGSMEPRIDGRGKFRRQRADGERSSIGGCRSGGQQRQRLLWSSLESSEDPRTCAFVLYRLGNNGSGYVVDLDVAGLLSPTSPPEDRRAAQGVHSVAGRCRPGYSATATS